MKHYLNLIKIGALSFLIACGTLACQKNPDNVQANDSPSTPAPAAAAANPDTNPSGLNSADKDFLNDAMKADNEEVEFGQLALQKSKNPDVKDYAEMLIKDHTADSKKVADLINKGARPDDVATAASAESVSNEKLTRLQSMSEPAFDTEFANTMVQDHQEDLQKYQDKASSAVNSDVRDYASDDVQVLQKHLQKAQDLQTKLGRQ